MGNEQIQINDAEAGNKPDLDKEVTLKQHEIANIISDARKKAHQRGYEQGVSTMQNAVTSQPQNQFSPEEVRRFAEEAAKQKLADEIQRLQQEAAQQKQLEEQQRHQQNADKFVMKLNAASQKYSDNQNDLTNNFREVAHAIGGSSIGGHLVSYLNELPNSEEVLHEFVKFPEKLAKLINLGNAGLYNSVSRELENLTNSSKKSQVNQNISRSQPINEIQPSHTGVGKDLVREMRESIRKTL